MAGLLRHAGGGPPHRGQRQPPAPLPPARRARRPGGPNSKVTHADHARVTVYWDVIRQSMVIIHVVCLGCTGTR